MPTQRRLSGFPSIALACGLVAVAYTGAVQTRGLPADGVADEAAAAPLPLPWISTDIGGPVQAGDASLTGETFQVVGGGTDIWGEADQFHFVYQPLTGDTEIIARVASLQGVDTWSKAGVMIRAGLTGDAAEAAMIVSAAGGWEFQNRPSAGSASTYTPGCYCLAPGWVRLVRAGDLFSAYQSGDGRNWQPVGSARISMPGPVYVGLAVTSRKPDAIAAATFTNVTVGTSNNAKPVVSIDEPGSGARFDAPATITLTANASDLDGRVVRVDFYQGDQLLGSAANYPFWLTWNGVAAGTYRLTAVATDDEGATATSQAVTVTVGSAPGDNAAPTVSIYSPTPGASYAAPASFTIRATAADTDGSVARVDFYAGSQLLGSDTSSPFRLTWRTVPAGTYSLTAVATDNDGARGVSQPVAVTVTGAETPTPPPTPPPTVPTRLVFVPPADYAGNVTSVTVQLRRAGEPTSAAPVASGNLGKPGVVAGEVSVDISGLVNPLAAGSYYGVVVTTGPGGSTSSSPSGAFSK